MNALITIFYLSLSSVAQAAPAIPYCWDNPQFVDGLFYVDVSLNKVSTQELARILSIKNGKRITLHTAPEVSEAHQAMIFIVAQRDARERHPAKVKAELASYLPAQGAHLRCVGTLQPPHRPGMNPAPRMGTGNGDKE